MRRTLPGMLVTGLLLFIGQSAVVQDDLQKRVTDLNKRVEQLEANQRAPVTEIHRESGGAVLFLFGAFCVLWRRIHESESVGMVLSGLVLPRHYRAGAAGQERG